MAGEWLKFECSLPEKPETLAITAAMGWDDPDLTVGKLMRLFRWFDQHTVDGNATGVTAALLDRIIGVTGFVQAVINVGWLVAEDGGLALHNFDRHNGATAKSRALTAKRVANHRSNGEGNADCNATTVTGALAREEKKGEEEKEPIGSSSSGDDGRSTVRDLIPPCPQDRIRELYAEILPTLPQPKLWREARQKALRSRWTEMAKLRKWSSVEDGLNWFRRFFEAVSEDDFLMGRTKRSAGHENWEPGIDYLLRPDAFCRIVETAGRQRETA